MQIVFFDCQPDVCLNSLIASLIDAGLSFDAWSELAKSAAKNMQFDVEFVLHDVVEKSIRVKRLSPKRKTTPSPAADISALEALDCLEKSGCSDVVINLSRTIFARLLEAEAAVRGIKSANLRLNRDLLERTLLEIVGFALAYRAMKIDSAFCATPSILSGQSLWRHENEDADFSPQSIDFLLTQAAAPISHEGAQLSSAAVVAALTTVVSEWAMPSFAALRKVGYGQGSIADAGSTGSLCRVLVGEMQAPRFRKEMVSVLEANLDDLSPQVLSFTCEELFAAGALDVFITSATMKKGRSGHLLTALCNFEDKEKMQAIIFAQTSTLGVRSYECERSIAEREFQKVDLDSLHSVKIKVGFDLQGNVINAQPEYEDCAAYARFSGQSIQEVMQLAIIKFRDSSVNNSAVVAILLACFVSLAVIAKSPTPVPSQPAQFAHVLRQAHVGTLKNENGFEIYSWNVGGKWHYSLLPASKEERTFSEVTDSSITRKGFIELETALGKLAPCVVTWHNHVLKEDSKSEALSMPHQVVLNQLKKYCQTRQLKLEL